MEWLESRRVLASTFGHERIDLPIENSGVVMEVADLNGDELDDLIIGTGVGTVEVLLNNGNASFSNAQSLPVGGLVRSLTLADLDGDNRATDLLVHTVNGITPILDQGIADDVWQGYRAAVSFGPRHIYHLEAANMNGDEFADIVYGWGDSLFIRIGQSDLSFGDPLEWGLGGTGENHFDVGDVNGDGFDDIVATTPTVNLNGFDTTGEGPIKILTNDQGGSFEEDELQGAAKSIELFDFNSDGRLDILAEGFPRWQGTSVLYLGDGNGEFNNPRNLRSISGHFRAVSDSGLRAHSFETRLGHGGFFDYGGLFVESYDTSTRQETNEFRIGIEPWRSGAKPYFANFLGNGREQIIGLAETSLVVVSEQETNIVSTEEIQLEVPMYFKSVSFRDVNGDGFDDVASWSQFEPLQIRWGGPTGVAKPVEFEMPVTATVGRNSVGDIDGDGWLDRVSTAKSDIGEVLLVERGIPTDVPGETQFDDGVYYKIEDDREDAEKQEVISLGDVTGDGVLDVIFFTYPIFGARPEYQWFITVLPGVSPLQHGDVNRDGIVDGTDLELLVARNVAQEVHVPPLRFDMTGDGRETQHDVDHWIEFIAETQYGDLDLDGDVDFADFLQLSNNFGSTNAVWSDGDLDGDGNVAFADFLILSQNFGFERHA